MFDLGLNPEDMRFVREAVALLAALLSGILSALTAVGLRKKWKEKRALARIKRSVLASVAIEEARRRAEWYSTTYRLLCIVPRHFNAEDGDLPPMDDREFHDLTVQQACGLIDAALPKWAYGGWERVQLSHFNVPVKTPPAISRDSRATVC